MNGYDPATYGSNDNPKTSNSVWSYSREITINPATPSNNYQIKIKLNSSIFNYGSVNNRTYKHELTEKGFEALVLIYYFKKYYSSR